MGGRWGGAVPIPQGSAELGLPSQAALSTASMPSATTRAASTTATTLPSAGTRLAGVSTTTPGRCPPPNPRLARGLAPPLPSRVGHRLRVPPQRLAHQREPGAVQRGLRPLLRAGGAPRQEALSRPGPPQPLEVGGCCLPGPRLQPPSPLWRDVGGGRGAAAHAAPGGAFVNKFTKKKNHTKKPKSGGVKGWGWVLRLGMGSV